MQTQIRTPLMVALALFVMGLVFSAQAHFISGHDAPVHNAEHLAPILAFCVLASIIGFVTFRRLKSK